ncbi:Retron-type RNA-directed DNA polymerase [hydrothermal vent metagenome]|uniref:Retron-type RNA-directed DNA polymerase n=1 Tax=hydrothermal vent metagenome TaxID=652676 RepID=A0A3B0Z623_9ZZZZ
MKTSDTDKNKPKCYQQTLDLMAETTEGRTSTKRNIDQSTTRRTQCRVSVSCGLIGVRERAKENKDLQFTALLHHVTVDLLHESYLSLKRKAASGVDQVTWQSYGENLEINLQRLHSQIHQGSYRAKPTLRRYIPKADGSKRPLGITCLEDKISQQAIVTVLNNVYEEDFLGFSYGYRLNRSQHDALDAVWMSLMGKRINWVLDIDIKGFFDSLDHHWLNAFLKHRIADKRILRLINKWLKAGISEDGKITPATVGTPQGSVISPLLANIYLHYVFDLWINQWRKCKAQGVVTVVRYADDMVVGFQEHSDAENFQQELKQRLESFSLCLHPKKTRLIEFGRFAEQQRRRRGLGKPETFEFLGFTHVCARKRKTKTFIVKRLSIKKRLRERLKVVYDLLLKNRHKPIEKQGRWLRSVVLGFYNYHAVPGNNKALEIFKREIARYWLKALRRRSQRSRLNWFRFQSVIKLWIPTARILHDYPNERFYVKYSK